jgi:hypothetical protein
MFKFFDLSSRGGRILQLKGPQRVQITCQAIMKYLLPFIPRHALSIFHTSITAAKHLRVATLHYLKNAQSCIYKRSHVQICMAGVKCDMKWANHAPISRCSFLLSLCQRSPVHREMDRIMPRKHQQLFF